MGWLAAKLADSAMQMFLQCKKHSIVNYENFQDQLRLCGLVDVQQTTEGTRVASFPGLPTLQFLITYSIQKLDGGKVWPILSRKCLDRGGKGSSISRMHFARP